MQEPTLIEKQTRKFVVTNPLFTKGMYKKGDTVIWKFDEHKGAAYFVGINWLIFWSELEFADEEFRVGDTVEIKDELLKVLNIIIEE
jgi:hypothetical protein